MTVEEDIKELQKRILTLEEEKEALKKKLETRADKMELENRLNIVTEALHELRELLGEKKDEKKNDAGEESAGGGFFS